MNDSLGMEVVQAIEDLSGEGLRHVLVEPTQLSQDTGDRTAWNVFKETINPLSAACQRYTRMRTNMLRYLGVSSNPRYWTTFW